MRSNALLQQPNGRNERIQECVTPGMVIEGWQLIGYYSSVIGFKKILQVLLLECNTPNSTQVSQFEVYCLVLRIQRFDNRVVLFSYLRFNLSVTIQAQWVIEQDGFDKKHLIGVKHDHIWF